MKILDSYIANPNIASRNVIYRLKKSLLIHIRKEINTFNNAARQAVLQQKSWIQHADSLTKNHKKLRNEIDGLKQELG